MKKRYSQKKPSTFSGIIAFLILFVIAATLLNYLIPVIIFLGVTAIIVGVVYILFKSPHYQEKESTYVTDNRNPANPTKLQNESIKRQIAILTESTELVNDSNNLDTVLRRYSLVCSTLEKLSSYTDYEIRNAGYPLKEPLSATLEFMQNNKATIINQAIERHVKNEISKLTTVNGKIKKIGSLYEKVKSNDAIEDANISFLEKLCLSLKEELTPAPVPITEFKEPAHALTSDLIQTGDMSRLTNLPETISPDSENFLKASPEIADLIWIGDGKYKNYFPAAKQPEPNSNVTIIFSPDDSEEPSTLYLSLPVSNPPDNALIERPPYYPSYKGLLPEQRWLYWEFLADPFSPKHNVGYAFLFYYGLERHLAFGNLDKAFDVTLRLRKIYNNNSFQHYTADALTLICIAKQRSDLALKLIRFEDDSIDTFMPANYLLILKYTFQIPLTVSEIIKNHKYFEFHNNRYIKGNPELFRQTLSELLQRDFHENEINLNEHFPMDINNLPIKQERIFANVSLKNYEAPIPDFKNEKLLQSISALLSETHETVKSKLRELRKRGEI